jgi:hypothetical protein
MGMGYRMASVFIKTPSLVVLAEHQIVVVEFVNFQADIVERPETESLLYENGVCRLALFRKALDEKTVTPMLEIAVDFRFVEVLNPCDRT